MSGVDECKSDRTIKTSDCETSISDEYVATPTTSRKRKCSDRTSSKKKRVTIADSQEVVEQSNITSDCSNVETVENVLEDMEEEIDSALEKPCYKNKLTTANVKNILRHIIANEYVLAMVRNTMKLQSSDGENLGEVSYEPKLTRSKAKEMRNKQYTLPWPVSSPAKKANKTSKNLLDEEYPESSDDEDYKPTEDEIHSEDENVTLSPKTSDFGSPSSRISRSSSPIAKVIEPLSEDENALVIALPDLDIPPDTTEADKIALRTRSKLPLNDTPLEEIEASFIAPDIEIDMYDTHCDDEEWQEFLCELSKPIPDTTALPDHPDDADDPEYKVQEEDIPGYNDLRYDSSVKITRDELNALMAEILEFAQQDPRYFDDEDEQMSLENGVPPVMPIGPLCVESVQAQWMTSDERLQLDEQMRMYVQLLTQSYLLSHGNPEFNFINVSAKLFLDEMKMFASKEMISEEKSSFYAQNLDQALDIINKFENVKVPVQTKHSKKPHSHLPVPTHVRKAIATSKVFIYPELLPTYGFRDNFDKPMKMPFCTPEDNLVALGLEQFADLNNPVEYIHSLLVPAKSIEQIKFRIKNVKLKKDPMANSIMFYLLNKRAPQFQRVIRIFDPDNIRAPENYSTDVLPSWMAPYCKVKYATNPPLAPNQVSKPSPQVAVVRPTFRKAMEPRKYSPILPRGLHFSPLKQIIFPILKKYSQQRRVVPVFPLICTSPAKRTVPVPVMPKPDLPIEAHVTVASSPSDAESECSASISGGSAVLGAEQTDAAITSLMSESVKVESTVTEETSTTQKEPVSVSAKSIVPVKNVVAKMADEEEQEVVVAVPTTVKKQTISKKKNRIQRDLEASLALLQPTLMTNDPKKEEREVLFANTYLLRATEMLKGKPETYEKFLTTLCKFHNSSRSPVELYSELSQILKDYPALLQDFVVFLKPEQAMDCGKYQEHVVLNKMREFFRKIEVHFKNQPQHITRILKTIAQLSQQVKITSAEVVTALQPLLRNQSHLMEELHSLLPHASPPEYLMTDFETVNLPNSDDDNSSMDSCEEITIPDTPDPYGGKDCPCKCHLSSTDSKLLNKSRHCVKCGVKFIDGKIYIQTGKVLKPAQVTYLDQTPTIIEQDIKTTRATKNQSSGDPTSKTSQENNKSEAPLSKKDVASPPCQKIILPCNLDQPPLLDSKLPTDVIEDTVFPVMAGSTSKSAPSDFSQIRSIIASSKRKQAGLDDIAGPSVPKAKWTRDEDKLIIYNCQRYGISKKAFCETANAIETRSGDEVEERFLNLMKFLSKEIKKQ